MTTRICKICGNEFYATQTSNQVKKMCLAKRMSSKKNITLDEAELLLDKQLRKLELVDEEDQKSYKMIDYLLRTTDSIEGVVALKIKIEGIRQKN